MTDRPSAGAPSAGAPSARDPGVATVLAEDRSPTVTVRLAVRGAAQMRLLGARLAGLLGPGDLVVLAGALGAGKTTLVQGIGDGLGVRGPVTSPAGTCGSPSTGRSLRPRRRLPSQRRRPVRATSRRTARKIRSGG